MFGPRLTTVFASRWRALWFAASVCLLAYCTIPEQTATPPANDAEALAQAALGDDPFAQGARSDAAGKTDIGDATQSDEVKRVQALVEQMQQAEK